jgi:molecular chaperone DnaK (HSP70)
MATPPLIPVGLDLGSIHARVCVHSAVVSNTQGHRFTPTFCVNETPESFIYGDAARVFCTKNQLSCVTVQQTLADATAHSFLGYVSTLASDSAAVGADQLRLVVSVPVNATEEYLEQVREAASLGIKALIADKKKRKVDIVVGVMSEAAAHCVAHGFTQKGVADKTILVVDGGASGTKLTRMAVKNGVLEQLSHEVLKDVSGPKLVDLLAQFAATQFERQNKVPRGEVWESKKAKQKLQREAERALGSGKITITVDGLYEGMDCHMDVSKPRWDMMCGEVMSKVEARLVEMEGIDVVLVGGCLCKNLEPIVTKVFPNALRGKQNVPPEEGVAMGCAKQAKLLLDDDLVFAHSAYPNVIVSPVSIGFGATEDALETLIPMGTPLPAQVVHKFTPLTASCSLWQMMPSIKLVAELQQLEEQKENELVVELSEAGILSVALQGGPAVTI